MRKNQNTILFSELLVSRVQLISRFAGRCYCMKRHFLFVRF